MPDCKRPVERLKEVLFLQALHTARELQKHIEENRVHTSESKRNEIVASSKTAFATSVSHLFQVGIPVPGDPDHVMYVWFDALANYLGDRLPEEGPKSRFWPADCHIIGKDILRFHAAYFRTFLCLPVSSAERVHPRLVDYNQKMSKSKGNVVDPNGLIGLWN